MLYGGISYDRKPGALPLTTKTMIVQLNIPAIPYQTFEVDLNAPVDVDFFALINALNADYII